MSNNLQGILWALLATALATGAAAMIKYAAADFHILQILFVRQAVIFVFVLPLMVRNISTNLHPEKPGLHLVRLTGAFVALCSGFWAVSVLPLTTATVLSFSKTFFVTLLAARFLGEPIGIHRISALLAGFVGVLIVVRPNLDEFADLYALLAIISALGAAVAVTSVRRLSQTSSTSTLLSYQAIFVGILAGIPMFWLWITPDIGQFALLFGIGAVATAAQWFGIRSLRLGEAGIISSIGYTQLIYAAALGYLLFKEVPDGLTLLGAAIIISASIYTMRREAKSR